MERQLNLPRLQEAMHRAGLTQSAVAHALKLSRASVSKWFTAKSLPRPPELLKLGRLLQLPYAELVTAAAPASEPLIAFRKRAATKTTELHLERAREMGRLLAPLVKHLPFDSFVGPSRLKNPSLDYAYLQGLVSELRNQLRLDPAGLVKFEDLIGKFIELHAVIVPVMWGQKSRHENALHIYLPESRTTWIYLNLDSRLHDFKFWMAHELGHLLSVDLLEQGNTELAEDFADAFAGALLFPEPAARKIHGGYCAAKSAAARIEVVMAAADAHVISPYSVYCEVEKYARARGLDFTGVPSGQLHAAITRFNQHYRSVSEMLFDGKMPSADHYMRVGQEAFRTPVFATLGSYLRESPKADSVISRILDVPLVDAKELRAALV